MKVDILGPVGDNYIYLVTCGEARAAIDPTRAEPVLAVIPDSRLDLVLVTHDHFDHTAGCDRLRQKTGCRVIGPGSAADTQPGDGETIDLGDCGFEVLSVPGHTGGDVAYYAAGPGVVFTGDTLFAGGCGRVLGGSADQLWNSLKRLRGLPDDTRVYCGHEYTEDNLAFAAHLEPKNSAVANRLETVRQHVAAGQPAVPSTMGDEKITNPFMRCDDPAFKETVGLGDRTDADVFAAIRKQKDRW